MKDKITTITVYCASSTKIDPIYYQDANKLGAILAKNNIRCCTGGGGIGLMAAVSESTIEHGGEAVGVIPQFMVDQCWHHEGLSELVIVDNMHQRKAKMAELADAVIALPGGIGTMEELLEILTWKQLGLFCKPIIILNTKGYYNQLLAQLDNAIDETFMREQHGKMWVVIDSPDSLMEALDSIEPWDSNFIKIAAI